MGSAFGRRQRRRPEYEHVPHRCRTPGGRGLDLDERGRTLKFSSARPSRTPVLKALASTPSDTETAFMVQPGVGVTFVGGDGWGMFGQADYRRTFFDEPDDTEDSVNNQFRVFVGFRMILD